MKTKTTGTVLFLFLALITAFYSCANVALESVDPYDIINGNYNPNEKIVGMEIMSFPFKLTSAIGENADWTGLLIAESYSNGDYKIQPDYHNYTISGFDSSSPGIKYITVSKGGISAQPFTVTVNSSGEAVLVSLYIDSPPNKLVYEVGESADWTGLTLAETDSNHIMHLLDYHNYTISGFDSSSPGVKTIIVSKDGISAPSFTITVNSSGEAVLVSLSITSPPYKQVYEQGENADWAGLGVTGFYSNGSSRTETGYNIDGFDSSSPGVKTITVTKDGCSDYFSVSISLPIGSSWTPGTLTPGGVNWYSFSATGGSYSVNWNDSDNGMGPYSCDIKVSAYTGGGTNIFSEVDTGTTPQIISGWPGTIYLKVEGYAPTSSGSYAIRVTSN
jgi:hypothetical protein